VSPLCNVIREDLYEPGERIRERLQPEIWSLLARGEHNSTEFRSRGRERRERGEGRGREMNAKGGRQKGEKKGKEREGGKM
jgi:hypothetical protein